MNSRLLCFILAVAVFTLDQVVKHIISINMYLGQSIPVLKGLLHLTFVYNEGAAFSILKNQTLFLVFLAAVAVLFIVAFFSRLKKYGMVMILGVALLLGGTLGNMYDRLLYGYVIDFVDFRVWPIFNIADCGICVGAAAIAYALLWKGNSCERRENTEA